MGTRLFTIVGEFTGTTSVMQVSASSVVEAAEEWACQLRADMPFGSSSDRLAEAVEASLRNLPPAPLAGVVRVWCLSALCDDQLCLANIIETKPA